MIMLAKRSKGHNFETSNWSTIEKGYTVGVRLSLILVKRVITLHVFSPHWTASAKQYLTHINQIVMIYKIIIWNAKKQLIK